MATGADRAPSLLHISTLNLLFCIAGCLPGARVAVAEFVSLSRRLADKFRESSAQPDLHIQKYGPKFA
jgi:hypothetical protein